MKQIEQYLHPKVNFNQLLHTIHDNDKHKWTINYMVRDFCTIISKWHQSTALAWYDCLIHIGIMVLTILLRLDFLPNGNHHRKKDKNALSVL